MGLDQLTKGASKLRRGLAMLGAEAWAELPLPHRSRPAATEAMRRPGDGRDPHECQAAGMSLSAGVNKGLHDLSPCGLELLTTV